MSLNYSEVREYFEINNQMKILEERKKALNAKFKKEVGASKGKYEVNDLVVSMVPQDRSKINQERAISFVSQKIEEAKNELDSLLETDPLYQDPISIENTKKAISILKECLAETIILDEAGLETAIYKGVIIPEDFNSCIDVNIIMTMRVDPIKKPE